MNDTTTTAARERTIHGYLTTRSHEVELPPADLAAVVDRVARRRRNRRAAVSACFAVAVLGGALGAANLGDGAPAQVSASGSGSLVASDLTWRTVRPRAEVRWASATVLGPGDALYALSTAPGTLGVVPDEPDPTPVLYRSADGIEWATVSLPEQFHASALAGASDRLYAVGTAPAGGGRGQIVNLASNDGASSAWSRATLPLDLGALGRDAGDEVQVVGVQVAVRGTRTVVAVGLQSYDALERVLPTDARNDGYAITDDGIDVFGPAATPNADPATAMPKEKVARTAPVKVRSLTWAELGLDDATRALVLGQTRVFTSDDGITFAAGSSPGTMTPAALVATTDGFRLFTQSMLGAPTIATWSSVDGATWRADAAASSDGWLRAAGAVRGRAMFVAESDSGTGDREPVSTLHAQQADGTWLVLSLQDLVRRSGAEGPLYVQDAAIGPMGAVALVRVADAGTGRDGRAYLLRSVDGRTASVDDLTEALAGAGSGDVHVTADAITVGLVDADGAPNAGLLVGTRR
jgi:hypothetical protein